MDYKWYLLEKLDDYQNRAEQNFFRRRQLSTFSKKMYDNGWIFIDKDMYWPGFTKNFKTESILTEDIITTLKKEKLYIFDDHKELIKKCNLTESVREIAKRIDNHLYKFIEMYQGKDLMLHRDWYFADDNKLNDTYISWFIKRPKK